MRRLKVYIASPYTLGWQPDNVRRQLEAKHILLDHGFVPFAPLENHFSEIWRHRSETEWFDWDIEWLKSCDILVRIRPIIDGKELPSNGSDIEEKTAKENKLLVFNFNSLKELNKWCKKTKKEKLLNDCLLNKIPEEDKLYAFNKQGIENIFVDGWMSHKNLGQNIITKKIADESIKIGVNKIITNYK